jgi:hypothetical protein
MKPTLSLFVSIACVAMLLSCGPGNSGNEGQETNAADTTSAAHAVYMEGMYATSTRLPRSQYGLENMFDDKAETFWSTILGAGPDEGFVLYFPEKLYVAEVQLVSANDANLAGVKEVFVYADGQRVGGFDPSKPIAVNSDLSTLFIKIGDTNASTTEQFTSEYEEEMSLVRFDSSACVGFSGIKIFGRGGELQLVPPVSVKGSVVASSVLQPVNAYAANQLFDSRKELVWAEGSKGGGENEKLTFAFNEDQNISSMKIWNGYQRSEKHFESNARVKSFEFGLKNGSKTKYYLDDTMEPQTVKLTGDLKGKGMEFTVLEVYPGTNYKDLVLSEIVFFNDVRPVIIKDDKTDDLVKSVLAATKGSVLSSYIDRRLHNTTQYADYTSDKSLILRSNKTFVIYDYTESTDGSSAEEKEVVADGNWEIVEQKDGYAKVRIFGKLFNLAETTDYYQGNSSTEFVKIFQDNLHITPSGVKGEKVIDEFFNILPAAQ